MTGDRPDSSVTSGKTEEEVSALKAAACKEVIAVINVRPMSLELDTNMGHGSWNTSQASGEYTIDDINNLQNFLVNKSTPNLYDKDYDLNGDGVISYVMFKGQEGNAEAEARTQFGVEDANAVLTAAGKPELAYYNASATDKYLVDQGGKWSAQAANDYMATILPEYSEANGNMVELIICNNDGMAEGAVSALQGAGYNTGDGKTIPVFGVDATDSAKQLINEGKMTGTIKQDAEGMASTILNLVSSVQGGGELMDNTSSFNVDEGVAKIRVPYATYTGE